MPEQLTKYPEVTLQVLRSAGARCGEGAKQDILVQCPAGQFCKLPGGEVCVYGWPQAASMTQPTPADWQQLARQFTPAAQPEAGASWAALTGLAVVAFALGVGLSRWSLRRR